MSESVGGAMSDRVEVQLQVLNTRLGTDIPLPKQMSTHAAGLDVCAVIDAPIVMAPGARALVPCGFAIAVPPGYEAQVRPRSGLAAKHGITLLNSPGTIDADYRGEVKVLLVNHGHEPFEVKAGERIAQLVIAAVPAVRLEVVTQLVATDRGSGGFGSTGR